MSCCGFDSIPHDLGVLYTIRALGEPQDVSIEGFVRASGKPSGGTWSSAIDYFSRYRETKKQPQPKRPPPPDGREIGSTKLDVRYEKRIGRWVAPLPTIDPTIVKKSARAIPEYGRRFRYGHYVTTKSLPTMIGLGAGVGAMFAVAQVGAGANWLRRMNPAGTGPSEEVRARSKFEVTFLAEADGKTLRTRVAGADPGYGGTAKMVAESALCLAFDADLPERYGVVTTAAAMGDRLIARLQAAGFTFETLG